MKQVKESMLVFIIMFLSMLILAEVGNRYGSYTDKSGSFFMLVFWGAIISGIFTLIWTAIKHNAN
jgi:hypothetical protein